MTAKDEQLKRYLQAGLTAFDGVLEDLLDDVYEAGYQEGREDGVNEEARKWMEVCRPGRDRNA